MDRPPEQEPRRPVIRQAGEIRVGRHVADRRLRVARRPEAQEVPVPALAARRKPWHPALVFLLGFATLILIGTVVLMLPVSSAAGEWTPFLDALFTATSAVCVTGLVVLDTGTHWSGFGQAVILLLIQLGGLGFMVSATLLLLLAGYRGALRERVLLREALGGAKLGTVFTLARNIVIFTLALEAIGAIVLTVYFLGEHPAPQAVWWGLFHSVSAFNNAGFDVVGGFRSLTPYAEAPLVLLTVSALFILGGLSYAVVTDVARERRFSRLALDSKLVLVSSVGLLVVGTLGLLFTERANTGTLAAMEPGTRLLNAFFHSASSRTAGFSSVDTGAMTDAGLFLLTPLMFIGGSAASTAGGIKLQTFSLLLFAMISAARGLHDVQAFRRRVPTALVLRAMTIALLTLSLLVVVSFVLNVSEPFEFDQVLFEAVSALGTVGASTGITPDLTSAGRALLIPTMFIGRLGPLTLVLLLTAREHRTNYRWPEETVKIG